MLFRGNSILIMTQREHKLKFLRINISYKNVDPLLKHKFFFIYNLYFLIHVRCTYC